jgi:hypothetical protein
VRRAYDNEIQEVYDRGEGAEEYFTFCCSLSRRCSSSYARGSANQPNTMEFDSQLQPMNGRLISVRTGQKYHAL